MMIDGFQYMSLITCILSIIDAILQMFAVSVWFYTILDAFQYMFLITSFRFTVDVLLYMFL